MPPLKLILLYIIVTFQLAIIAGAVYLYKTEPYSCDPLEVAFGRGNYGADLKINDSLQPMFWTCAFTFLLSAILVIRLNKKKQLAFFLLPMILFLWGFGDIYYTDQTLDQKDYYEIIREAGCFN
jgi:hypothetical protein